MTGLPEMSDPRLLVGTATADDAGVYRLSEDTAIVQTVDVFTPVVDNPSDYGRIIAANCMSDVWAMGGEVLTVLNLLGFPPNKLPVHLAAEILSGIGEKVIEGGGIICGGHTWNDPELRAGLSVTGIIHPDRIIANAGARGGDSLVLTKPLGSGMLTSGWVQGDVDEATLLPVVDSMIRLNCYASRAMVKAGAHACTDVTGFSLLGHGVEMAQASGVSLEIRASSIPLFEGALYQAGKREPVPLAVQNRTSFGKYVKIHPEVDPQMVNILYDPQTSGGLLIVLPEDRVSMFMDMLEEEDAANTAVIGTVTGPSKGTITVLP